MSALALVGEGGLPLHNESLLTHANPSHATPFNPASPFTRSLRVAVVMTVLMGVLLLIEGLAERQVDRAYSMRYESRLLVDELQQSSEELTRLARTYVLTGELDYKRTYLSLLAEREGQSSELSRGDAGYKGRGPARSAQMPAQSVPPVPLLDRMRDAGFSEPELLHLRQAKVASDALSKVELAAMALVEQNAGALDQYANRPARHCSTRLIARLRRDHAGDRQRGQLCLTSAHKQALDEADTRAFVFRLALGVGGLLLLLAYWQVFRWLRRTLAGSADEIHAQITRIGVGDVEDTD